MLSESTLLVRPEHLNHHGFLFGGRLLEWLDEQAYIAAMACLHREANLVTIGIDRVAFRHAVRQGALLRFRSLPVHTGKTSLTVYTDVFELPNLTSEIFSAFVTFVSLDEKANLREIAPLLTESIKNLDSDPLTGEFWQEVETARLSRQAAKKAGRNTSIFIKRRS